ncbi:DUF3558 domain-containing protein [Nocardia abscessus]|uniref:DUF3558 domain-containing protein n=1 Tax=Nocardia abscessus TaxID=120957 RepID=UPI002456F761|nr:DUF3558 domain-containing protein [Nocardia abscessus]
MTSVRNSRRLAVLAVGAALVLTGCGPSSDGATPPTESSTAPQSIAAEAPTAFDTCKDIPQSVLDSEKLRRRNEANSDANGGIKWRGCRYGRTDGYFATITTSNLTVEMTRDKHFPEATEFTIGGRAAISTRQFDGPNIKDACTVNVAMRGGSLDINLLNPASNRDTGSIDSCQLARTLAEKIVPTMPSNA